VNHIEIDNALGVRYCKRRIRQRTTFVDFFRKAVKHHRKSDDPTYAIGNNAPMFSPGGPKAWLVSIERGSE